MEMPTTFVHFTSKAHAALIVESMTLLLSRTISNAVYAAAVGGKYVPGVQRGGGGIDAVNAREVAVLFTANIAPDTVFVEEVIWHRDTPLTLVDAMVIDHDEAVALLDGSANLPD